MIPWRELGRGGTEIHNCIILVCITFSKSPCTVVLLRITDEMSQCTIQHYHIVPHKKFDRIAGTSSLTFPNFKYGDPREICVERNCFDSPIAK